MAKRQVKQKLPELVRRDGALCATFVNSASKKRQGFATYAELVVWSTTHGELTAGQAQRLEGMAAARPEDAAGVVERAARLRACIERILRALAARQPPPADDLEALNGEISAALPARRLIPAGGGCRWAWGDRDGDDLDRMLWAVLFSAARVLCSSEHRRVRQCAGQDCGLMFVDRGAGSPRRWCEMKACGNRVKALRHYRKVVQPQLKDLKEKEEAERWSKARQRARERHRPEGTEETPV